MGVFCLEVMGLGVMDLEFCWDLEFGGLGLGGFVYDLSLGFEILGCECF